MKELNVEEKIMCEKIVKESLIWLEKADLNKKSDYYDNYLSSYIWNNISTDEFSQEFIEYCISVSIKIYNQTQKILYEHIYSL